MVAFISAMSLPCFSARFTSFLNCDVNLTVYLVIGQQVFHQFVHVGVAFHVWVMRYTFRFCERFERLFIVAAADCEGESSGVYGFAQEYVYRVGCGRLRKVWSAICFISGSTRMWSISVLGIVFHSFVFYFCIYCISNNLVCIWRWCGWRMNSGLRKDRNGFVRSM